MTDNEKHISAGYKSSPLGIIPEDWEVKRLGKIANRIGDGIHGTPKYTDKSEYYFINGNNLNNGKIVINDSTKCVPYSEYIKYKKNIPQHTILLSINGTIGNIALYNDEKVMLGKSAAYITIPNYKFFYHLLQSNRVLTAFEKELTGTTIRNLSLDSIRNLTIALPSQKEIESISTLLDLWDTAISKQTALIEKLTVRKRGLMQQLLTGKKRLKGFSGEWKRTPIKDFAKEVSLRNSNCEDHIVLSCTKYDGLVPSLEYFGKQIYSDDLSNYKIISKGHFAYATNHIEEGSIGYQSKYEYGLISPMYTVFITDRKKVDDTFLFAVFKSHHLIHLYKSMMEGSINRRGGLRWDSFSTIKIYLPPLVEQNAIASVLVDVDNEIELANKKLVRLQEEKRGLMQVLLTGKKRISIN